MKYNPETNSLVTKGTGQALKKRGRPQQYKEEELLELWEAYKLSSFWNEEEDSIKAFCKKHKVGYDTMRRYLGLKPRNSKKAYPKSEL